MARKEVTATVDAIQMDLKTTYYWLVQSEKRKRILISFNQPMTATQISLRISLTLDNCLHLIWGLGQRGLTFCLNPNTRFNRLHWLTPRGKECRRMLREAVGLKRDTLRIPTIPWDLFSSVCFSHRSAVVKAMRGPMQSSRIKKRALGRDPSLRMSANNVRDVMKYLLSEGIVRKVMIGKRSHPRFELTDLGRTFQELLLNASP